KWLADFLLGFATRRTKDRLCRPIHWYRGGGHRLGWVAQERQCQGAIIGLLIKNERLTSHVAENDVVDADMAPGTGLGIHDFKVGALALQGSDIERRDPHLVLIVAGGGADDVAIDNQIEATLAWMRAAANEEIDVASFNAEWPARQFACLRVAL